VFFARDNDDRLNNVCVRARTSTHYSFCMFFSFFYREFFVFVNEIRSHQNKQKNTFVLHNEDVSLSLLGSNYVMNNEKE